jgi:hypothetical protein
MSNSFPFSIGGSLLTSGNTVIFKEDAVLAFATNRAVPSSQTVSWSPRPKHALLRIMGKKIYAFGNNRLKTHEFRLVQLVNGSKKEGVGNTELGYVCVWAASGSAPLTLA